MYNTQFVGHFKKNGEGEREREREREKAHARGSEREGQERILSGFCTVSAEPDVGLDLTNL